MKDKSTFLSTCLDWLPGLLLPGHSSSLPHALYTKPCPPMEAGPDTCPRFSECMMPFSDIVVKDDAADENPSPFFSPYEAIFKSWITSALCVQINKTHCVGKQQEENETLRVYKLHQQYESVYTSWLAECLSSPSRHLGIFVTVV